MNTPCAPCDRSDRFNGFAEYVWHDERGYDWPLCASCFALWMLYSCEDEPGTTPAFTVTSMAAL